MYSHLLFRARAGQRGSAPSLLTAAFCLDPKALRADVRWPWDSFQSPGGVCGAGAAQHGVGSTLCSSGGPLGHSPCRASEVTLGMCMWAPFPVLAIPHKEFQCLTAVCHSFYTSNLAPRSFSSFVGGFIFQPSCLPAERVQKVLLARFHEQTFIEVAECCRVTLQLSVAPSALLTLESIDFLVVTPGGQLFWWKGM